MVTARLSFRFSVCLFFCQFAFNPVALPDDPYDASQLTQRGKALYNAEASCWVCHGENGEGRVGPAIRYGPSPFDIHYQLNTNPQMAALRQQLNPDHTDLLALSVYVRRLTGVAADDIDVQSLAETLNSIQDYPAVPDFFLTDRDKAVQQIEAFDTVLRDWKRRSKPGNIMHSYTVREVATFEPAEPLFKPEPGGVYFYENLATSGRFRPEGVAASQSTQVVVGDAVTKQVLASYELPEDLRGAVHTTVASPDGKYIYIIGARPHSRADTRPSMITPQTLLKVDALSLQPVKQFVIGARLHHGQIFQDRYLLLDSFSRDQNGLDVMLFDPQTDQIIGGVRSEELGGAPYTAFSDGRFIYVLMEPLGYGQSVSGDKTFTGYVGSMNLNHGRLTTMRPFWIAKIDPETWQVVKEYPYPGYRADWIAFDSAAEFMYVPAGGSATLSKINIETGEVVWASPTGIGPYGANLNASGSEVWVADKGETTGMFGRTISVIASANGRQIETLFSAYQVDHVLLAPNGREFWTTSNGEGRIYVFDAEKREQSHVIDMPQFGSPHGLVWVHYDENGHSKVVRDQGGFHGGVDPRKGKALDY